MAGKMKKTSRLYDLIMESGYTSVAEFCRINEIPPVYVYGLIGETRSPIADSGSKAKYTEEILTALDCSLEDAFSPDWCVPIKYIGRTIWGFDYAEFGGLFGRATEEIEETIERDYLKDYMLGFLEQLTKREQTVIKMSFGIGLKREYTLDEIADTLCITRERVRQIEAKALRKMRHPSRSDRIFKDWIDLTGACS